MRVFHTFAPLKAAHSRHNYRPCTHVGVLVVTVGSQENFGHFVHPAEEERQLPLVGGAQKVKKKKIQSFFTKVGSLEKKKKGLCGVVRPAGRRRNIKYSRL